MIFAAVGGGFGGAATEIDGAVEVSEGIVDGGDPGRGLRRHAGCDGDAPGQGRELAEVSLLEEGFAVGGKGEGGGERANKNAVARNERKRNMKG